MWATSCVAKKREGRKKGKLRVEPDFKTFAVGQANLDGTDPPYAWKVGGPPLPTAKS